jgi:hypothetical protein
MKEEYKQVSIGELLEESDFKVVNELCNAGQWDRLRKFLNEPGLKSKLQKRGVLPDYLFYFLQHSFTQAEEIE